MSLFKPIPILALATLFALETGPAGAAVIVQLRVVEGEGAVYPIGSRATRGLTVQVTDETGKPVDGASVSFRLPEQGPGGTFSGGLRTEVVTTHADGKASIWGMQWNKTPGPFEIRITAVKDQARAGVVSGQILSEASKPVAGGTGSFQASHNWHAKWWLIAAAGVGVGAAAAAVGLAHSKTAATTPSVAISIGNPSIILGPPK